MKRFSLFIALLLITSIALGACTPAAGTTATTAPVTTEAVAATTAPVEPTQIPATSVPAGPTVGGTFVMAITSDPLTFDWQKSLGGVTHDVFSNLGAALVAAVPTTGEIVPYLAESWTVSADGLTYTFKLRNDVKFQDGTPLTAADYVFTLQRILDPATGSPAAGILLVGVKDVVQLDDYSFQINMNMPNQQLLFNLASQVFFMPIPKNTFTTMGEEEFFKHPISAGPFMFKEYVAGEKIVLERFPDFNWGPSFTHSGAAYLQTLEFRIVPDQTTIVAGMEAGEVDSAAMFYQDAKRLSDSGKFDMYEFGAAGGTGTELEFNVSKPPFDDVKVRQAFNYALDREDILQIYLSGRGIVSKGPVTPATVGYWPGADALGYTFDLEKAKTLMQEAGYTYGPDGMLSKDGTPFSVELFDQTIAGNKVGLIVQSQLKALGVDVQVTVLDPGVANQRIYSGDFQFRVSGIIWPTTFVLYAVYHSSFQGVFGVLFLNDPTLDTDLQTALFTGDAAVAEQANEAAITRITEQAYTAPLFAENQYYAISNRIGGISKTVFSYEDQLWLNDAYVK
jgi:peptide/nickel transport system substrate-binding protein